MKEIILFGKCLQGNDAMTVNNNKIAMEKGYIIHPDCSASRAVKFLETLPNNLNTTFYQEWADVTEMSRLEILSDQVKHYASTYGTDFEGEAYIPNANPTQDSFKDLEVLMPISFAELTDKVRSMLYSGIALKEETISMLIDLIDELHIPVHINQIKNKEAMCRFCAKMKVTPQDPIEMMRYLVYNYTGSTTLIKSPQVIQQIKRKPSVLLTELINIMSLQYNMDALKVMSSVFHRFKPLFLAMKKGNEKTVNKLRRLANKHHKPMIAGKWETILSSFDISWVTDEEIDKISNFKKLRLLNEIAVRRTNTGVRPFTIRNGKVFIKEGNATVPRKELFTMLLKSLVRSLKDKACRVKLPSRINLTAPTSEKSFVGHIPYGSSVKMGSNCIVGIHWTENGGARDLDLSMLKINGVKVGWNGSYNNDGVVYSGDMTSADPEATEMLWCGDGMIDGVVQVNAYRAKDNSKYHMFLATDANIPEKNQMVHNDCIDFMTPLEVTGEQTIGMFVKNRFIFMDLNSSDSRVSRPSDHMLNYLRHMRQVSDTFIDLEELLVLAGFEFVDKNPDLDLSVADKSVLIDLFR